MIRRILFFVAGCITFWGLLAYPAYRLGKIQALTDSAIAAGFCLLPGVLTLVWGNFGFDGKPKEQLWIVLGGTGVGELKSKGKPFDISTWDVWEAWEKVKATGVDGKGT